MDHSRFISLIAFIFFLCKNFFLCIVGLWVFVTLLPTLMLANEENDKPLGKQDYLGWALWATGMFFEIVADMQKTSFKNDSKNQVSKMPYLENVLTITKQENI